MSAILLSTDLESATREAQLKAAVGQRLANTYPGHIWGVEMQGAMLNILCGSAAAIGRRSVGCSINCLKEGYSSSNIERIAVKYGGELLERAKLKRARYDHDEYRAAPKDRVGNVILDAS